MAANPKIIVVGGGLAGLSAAIKIAELGGHVQHVLAELGAQPVADLGGLQCALGPGVHLSSA